MKHPGADSPPPAAGRAVFGLPAGEALPARRRGCWLALGAVVAAGVALRVGGLCTDFWLDEVWSYTLVQRVRTWPDVFTAFAHENNHHLYTLYMYILGLGVDFHLYRLLALAAGLALLGVIAWEVARAGTRSAARFLVLVVCCYPLVHYASEARGYAVAGGASVAAWWLLTRGPPTRYWLAWYNLLLIVGFLSHLTFVFCLPAFGFWLLADRMAGEPRWSAPLVVREGVRVLAWHSPVLAVMVTLWAVDLCRLQSGEATEQRLPAAVAGALAQLSGWQWAGAGVYLGAGLALVVLGGEIASCLRQRQVRQGVFFALLFVTPAVILCLRPPKYFYVRYLLVLFPFALLLVARFLSRLAGRGRAGQVVAFLLTAAFVTGGLWQSLQFLRYGRGHYRAAVRYLAAHTATPTITVTSDHDFRQQMLLEFYRSELPPGRDLVYVPRAETPARLPDWVILQKTYPPAEVQEKLGTHYALAATFPHYGLSGGTWHLYRRQVPSAP